MSSGPRSFFGGAFFGGARSPGGAFFGTRLPSSAGGALARRTQPWSSSITSMFLRMCGPMWVTSSRRV